MSMGKADIITKQYLTDNSVFADAFNFFLYNGKQVLQPDQLRPLDTVAAETIFADTGTTIPVQKIRDNLKYLTMMTDDSVAYAILGIENQTDVHYAMPVRNMLYDAMEYSRQVQHISAKHRKEQHCDISSGEYLSGFYHSDRLLPVITLVI